MAALVDPNNGQIVQASHVTQLTGLVRGTANKGQNVRIHRQTNLTDYAVIVGNVDTTHGYALKVIAGDPDGTPTTLAAFDLDGGLTLRTGAKAITALEHPLASLIYPFIQSQGDYARAGLSVGLAGTPLAADAVPILNIQHRVAPDAASSGGLASASNFLGAVRTGTFGDSGTATGTQTLTTLQDTTKAGGSAWTVNAWRDYSVYIYSGTGATQVRKIISNTSNTLTVAAWVTLPVTLSSLYVINSASGADHSTLSVSMRSSSGVKVFNGGVNTSHAAAFYGTLATGAGSAGRIGGTFVGVGVEVSGGMGIGSEINVFNQTTSSAVYWDGSNHASAAAVAGLLIGSASLGGGSVQASVGIAFGGTVAATDAFKTIILFDAASGDTDTFGMDFRSDWAGSYPLRIPNGKFIYSWTAAGVWATDYAGRTAVNGGTHKHFALIGSNGSNQTIVVNDASVLVGTTAGGVTMNFITSLGDTVQGTAALLTTAQSGWLWIESCAGTPTGTPTGTYTGRVALVYDSTNNKIYVRNGAAWKSTVALT